jgi:hypothetical protein
MRPVQVPAESIAELRAAVKAFASEPGPDRFFRMVELLDAVPDSSSGDTRRPDRAAIQHASLRLPR